MKAGRGAFAFVVALVAAGAYACASADTGGAVVLNQWRLVSLTTKDFNGRAKSVPVSGTIVLRSDLAYTEDFVIEGTHPIELGTYAVLATPCDLDATPVCPVTGTITLTVSGGLPTSYSYKITTVDGAGPDGGLGGTMTWTSGALPDGGEVDAGPNAESQEWTFSLDSNTLLPQ